MKQPAVIGEMVAGILLGPSLLGRVAPALSAHLFPTLVLPFLSVVSQIGVILFMFLVGVQFDLGLLRNRTRAAVAISHASIVAPFLCGAALALWLYPSFSSRGVSFAEFALFIGVSMSVTAFPVLARILTDRRMHESRIGSIALACAAVDDVTAWCLLAFVVGVARAQPGRIFLTVGLTAAFIILMLTLVRPAALWFVRSESASSLLLAEHDGDRLCRAATFCFGYAADRDSRALRRFSARRRRPARFRAGSGRPRPSSKTPSSRFFCPCFLCITGLRTAIGLVHGARDWIVVRRYHCSSLRRGSSEAASCRPASRAWAAGSRVGRRPDEHARLDGADRAECRTGSRCAVASALRDVRADGARDHVRDHAYLADGPRRRRPHPECPTLNVVRRCSSSPSRYFNSAESRKS